jgi:hypothetical protein
MVRFKTATRVSGDTPGAKPSDIDDELQRRLIINFGRSVGASRLAAQALLQGAVDDLRLRQDLLMGIDDQLKT